MIRIIKQEFHIWLILLLTAILRLISINQSLWLDEATTALVAKMSMTDIFGKFLPGDFHPPFYYLLMNSWVKMFGSSEISLRIPSVIFGTASVYFVYLISKKLFDKKTALIASALSATSGLLIYYSQEARMYGLAALLVSAAFYLFLEKRWILFSISLALLGMTDYIALLVIPMFLIFDKENRKKVLVSLIPLVVVFMFWLPTFWNQISGGLGVAGSAWWNILGTLSWKNLALIPVKFILGRISFDNKIIYALAAIASCSVFGFLLIKSLKAPKLIWAWLVTPILLGILISIKVPILYYFRFLFCLPALYILVGRGISSLRGFWFGGILSAAILINIFSSGYYLMDTKFQREDWRGIARAIGTNAVVYPSNSQEEALVYYGKGNQIVYFYDFNGGDTTIWLSRYIWQIFDPGDKARIKVENLGYNKVQELNLNGVEFWKYENSH